MIKAGNDDHASRSVEQSARIGPLVEIAVQVRHRSGPAGVKPGSQILGPSYRFCRGDTAPVEADISGLAVYQST